LNYTLFHERIKEAVNRFRKVDKKETIRIISHLDADGIAACSILVYALMLEKRKFLISIVPQLNLKIMEELSAEEYHCYFFTDIGSGSIPLIGEKLAGKEVFVLDHHIPNGDDRRIIHVNPCLFGIDGGKEISGAGTTYLFASELNKKCEEISHLAIIGAIGDVQERNGFIGINEQILKKAIEKELIEVKKGLNFFGVNTKPLHNLLRCADVGFENETKALNFLEKLEINYKNGNTIKRFEELEEDDKKRLVSGLILRNMSNKNTKEIIGDCYILKKEKEGPLRDAREFSTILNSCGRLNKSAIAISACLGDENAKKKAIAVLQEYREEIKRAIAWYKSKKDDDSIFYGENFLIINAKNNILPTIAGTLCSIISRSNQFKPGVFIMALARDGSLTKISLRVSGDIEIDLHNIMKQIVEKAGGEFGGHKSAAGAVIESRNENIFIDAAKEIFTKTRFRENF